MRVSVFGLGYVGTISAGCLAASGHQVIGVDTNLDKVDMVAAGRSPIVEKGAEDLLANAVRCGNLQATTDEHQAVLDSDISLLCVGTPSGPGGMLNVGYLTRVCDEIGTSLASKEGAHTVVVRSTVLPGTTRHVLIPILEKTSGRSVGTGLGVCVNPEFLREGSALQDFYNAPTTVIGAFDSDTMKLVASLYESVHGPRVFVEPEVAELLKYVDNSWHALKIGFANEVGILCKAYGLDSHEVMNAFVQDTKLNLSARYLKPGFAFGGSCLPKDVRAVLHEARMRDLDLPIVSAVLTSNQLQIQRAYEMIAARGGRRVGVLGLSFKPGTDDLRESPMVELVERLIGKGYEVKIYDRNVRLARLVGANRAYVVTRLPHIARLMVDTIDQAVTDVDTVVIGNDSPEFTAVGALVSADQTVIDLVRAVADRRSGGAYEGNSW